MRHLLGLISLALVLASGAAQAAERINVVASFSRSSPTWCAMSAATTSTWVALVGPDGDAHVYAPTPADAKKVADARLLVINGLGFEGWLPRLLQASGSKAPIAVATKGIMPRKLGGHDDPHAWQSVANAKIYVANIRDGLIAAAPDKAAVFKANADAYLARLEALDREVHEAGGENTGGASQGDLDPRRLRLFRRRLRDHVLLAAQRLHGFRAQRARYRRHRRPDQACENSCSFSRKYQRSPPDPADRRPRPAPGSAAPCIRTV